MVAGRSAETAHELRNGCHLAGPGGPRGRISRRHAELASFVAATEPDTLLYAPFQTRGQMGIYVVLELYRSEAAHKAHLQNIQGLACFARLAELIAERTCVLSLDPLGDTPNSELVGAEFRHCSLE